MFSWIWGGSNGTEASDEGHAAPSEQAPAQSSFGSSLFSFGSSVAYKNQRKPADRNKRRLVKLVMLGESGVGKSSFLTRLVSDRFSCAYKSTIGADFMTKEMLVNGERFMLQLWDTAGQERFQCISRVYYRGSDGVFLVFDITSHQSFDAVLKYIEEVRKMAPPHCVVVLVGQKVDLSEQRAVSIEEATSLARELGVAYVETSAKNNTAITTAVEMMCRQIASYVSPRKANSVALIRAAASAIVTGAYRGDAQSEEVCVEFDPDQLPDEIDDDDAEEFDEAELENDLSTLMSGRTVHRKGRVVRGRRADVNVFQVSMRNLEVEVPVITGEPMLCSKCGCVLNKFCKVSSTVRQLAAVSVQTALTSMKVPSSPSTSRLHYDIEKAPPIHESINEGGNTGDEPSCLEETTVWTCNFCGQHNDVGEALDEGEIPHVDAVEFLIEPAPQRDSAESYSNVVFCIDTSGSMCVTTEINGRVKVKGLERRRKAMEELYRSHGGDGNQYLPSQRRGNSMISRLQCVQAAVELHIEKLVRENPETRVSLVSFSDDVTIIGDGSQEEVVVAGDKLDSFEQLQEIGKQHQPKRSVADAKDDLLERLWDLTEGGATALGPALQLSIGISGTRAGGTVVLCTDGLANIGVGSLEGEERDSSYFYTEMGEQGRLGGVTVNVVTLVGDECRVEMLSDVTRGTGGEVTRVEPAKLVRGFDGIQDNETLGFITVGMVLLHPSLQFRGEDVEEGERRNWMVKDLGNVNAETALTFGYGFRSIDQYNTECLEEVPFQVQLLYSKKNGERWLRVATTNIRVTDDRGEAEANADVSVVATRAAQRAARLAKSGHYEAAQLEARSAQRFLQRTNAEKSKLSIWAQHVDVVDSIARAQSERSEVAQRWKNSRQKRVQQRDDATATRMAACTKESAFW